MSGFTTQPARAGGEFAIGGDLPVVRLGYGAMQIPGPGVWGEPRDHDEIIRVLRRALELGATFIDTADSYGPEVSERLIHEALHPYPDGMVVATKAGFMRPGPGRWETNGKPEYLRAPRVRREQGREHAHERGLAGAVGPEQAEDRPLGDLEVDPAQRQGLAEALDDALDGNGGSGGVGLGHLE